MLKLVNGEGTNPIIPSWWDAGLVVLSIVFLALLIVTTISILRSQISPVAKLAWFLIALAFPLIGPAVWFLTLRNRKRLTSQQTAPNPVGLN